MKPLLCFSLFISPFLSSKSNHYPEFIHSHVFLYTFNMYVCIPLAINTTILFVSNLYVRSIILYVFYKLFFPYYCLIFHPVNNFPSSIDRHSGCFQGFANSNSAA